MQKVGHFIVRSVRHQSNTMVRPYLSTFRDPLAQGDRHPGNSMDKVELGLCVPSITSCSSNKGKQERSKNHFDSTRLAQKIAVSRNSGTHKRTTMETFHDLGPSVSRSNLPSEFTVTKFDGLAIESRVIRDLALLDQVIQAMLKGSIIKSLLQDLEEVSHVVQWPEGFAKEIQGSSRSQFSAD